VASPRTACPSNSFHSLLADLATFTRNEVTTAAAPDRTLIVYPRLTPSSKRAFDLLDEPQSLPYPVNPTGTQYQTGSTTCVFPRFRLDEVPNGPVLRPAWAAI
jgi:hypothetical protein